MPIETARSIILSREPKTTFLTNRTVRSMALQNRESKPVQLDSLPSLIRSLRRARQPILLAESGIWFARKILRKISPSATGKPLVAYGNCLNDNQVCKCLYLEIAACRALADFLADANYPEAIARLLQSDAMRVVHLPELDHYFSDKIRVLQAITTLQIGGAERIALELADGLNQRGTRTWTAVLNRPSRTSLETPVGYLDLSSVPGDPQSRAKAIHRHSCELMIDLIHGHLLSGEECAEIYSKGVPFVSTLHNMPSAWPKSILSERRKKADLFIACSQKVEKEITRRKLGFVRTAWNGICSKSFQPIPERFAEAQAWRKSQGWNEEDVVIITVANPRKQKQLQRIPEIIYQLRLICPGRTFHFVWVGEVGRGADSVESMNALNQQAELNGVKIHKMGGCDPSLYLLASDIFLSTSDYEGLSVAQLEALAAGVPVVATDVGGAEEVQREMKDKR